MIPAELLYCQDTPVEKRGIKGASPPPLTCFWLLSTSAIMVLQDRRVFIGLLWPICYPLLEDEKTPRSISLKDAETRHFCAFYHPKVLFCNF